MKVRIRCTDGLGNVAYIHRTESGEWRCTLRNGTPAAFSYAVGNLKDEMQFRFDLEDARTPEEALRVVRRYAYGWSRKVELV